MASTFKLQIVTPERAVLDREVECVTAPAYDGYLGVMARHAPMVAELQVGTITITAPQGDKTVLAVTGGILSVSNNVATVLADTAELASEIDPERAREAEERARARLASVGDAEEKSSVDVERARVALARAINRLRVASKQL